MKYSLVHSVLKTITLSILRGPSGPLFLFLKFSYDTTMELTPTIIYEDVNVMVVNKPSGLLVHSDGRSKEPTLVDWFLSVCPEAKGVGEPLVIRKGDEERVVDRPGIVHRLDKDTSGVMILAKNQDTHQFLKKQFQNRTTQKTYLCAVWGNIKEESGVIDAPIGKSRKDFRQWQAGEKARGTLREAVTEFTVLKRIQENGEYFCVCEVKPKTGRTHQIRVHMKYLHHPLVCDSLYADKRPQALGFDRLALHAWKLEIDIPEVSRKEFVSEIPEGFQKLLPS